MHFETEFSIVKQKIRKKKRKIQYYASIFFHRRCYFRNALTNLSTPFTSVLFVGRIGEERITRCNKRDIYTEHSNETLLLHQS